MNAFVAKEFRLLFPAWAAALLLALAPIWFEPGLALPLFAIGALMVGLSSFGREFGLKTFPLILAQPLERRRVWRTKTRLLAAGLGTILLAWCAAVYVAHPYASQRGEFVLGGGVIAMAAFAGGLWTTLLLRQTSSAFWFCILVPAVLHMSVVAAGGSEVISFICLGVYSIAAFLWARRYFFRIEEAAWTGGDISIADWAAGDSSPATRRSFKPFEVLCRKELQLHQFNLFGMALLFLLHLGVIGLRKIGHDARDAAHAGLHVFGGIWFIVPLLVASTSVAEERKLGTNEAQLCLPVSRRAQFLLKFVFVLIIGALLSSFLAWLAESVGSAIHAGADIELLKTPFNPNALGILSLISLGLALAGFYGSTLSRGIVQALAIGLFTACAGFPLLRMAPWPEGIVHVYLWRGPLIYCILLPAVIGILIWLAWRNFAFLSETKLVWRRNLLAWLITLCAATVLTAGIYHRAWEFLTPIEPRHGPARFSGVNSVRLRTGDYAAIGALLPDGKLWFDKLVYEPGPVYVEFKDTEFRVGGKFVHLVDNHVLAGSNWVDAVVRVRETVALRADGTLWVSDRPVTNTNPLRGPRTLPNLVQVGQDNDWQSVIGEYRHSLFLLKQNGTLWHWGTNDFVEKATWSGLRAFAPRQVGHDADWARIENGSGWSYGWKTNGTAWRFYWVPESMDTNTVLPGLRVERFAAWDNVRWRAFAYYANQYETALREDGTLWGWSTWDPVTRKRPEAPRTVQIGADQDWVALAHYWPTMTAIKKDGSLWRWPLPRDAWYREAVKAPPPPVRVGSHSDWVAIAPFMNGTISLAADGSLWFWDIWNDPVGRYMLRPSRKPIHVANILD